MFLLDKRIHRGVNSASLTMKRIHRPYPNLHAFREAHGLSQREAARQFGVSQSCWSKIELGQRIPRKELMEKLMTEAGVPLEVLAGIGR